MSIKAVMEGTYAGPYGQPLPNKKAAEMIVKTAEKVDETYGTDVKSKESQKARELSSQLHNYTITWNKYQSLSWASRVEGLLYSTGDQIQSGNYLSAQRTLLEIRKCMYGR